ncbi:hypothetical protein ABPG73_007834 [Tetrahymena malaccensis]
MNKIIEANECYLNALEINIQHLGAHNNLGLLYQSINMIEESKQQFLQFKEVNPQFVEMLKNIAITIFDHW